MRILIDRVEKGKKLFKFHSSSSLPHLATDTRLSEMNPLKDPLNL